MQILLLTQFYSPEVRTAPTNLASLAEDLQAKGHDVTVITGFPNHPFGRIYDGYRLKLWQWDEIRGVRILRLPLFPDHGQSKWRRMLNYGSFALSAMTLGAFFARNIKADVLFVYFAPLTIGWVSALFKRLYRMPVVYWVTDLWPENLQATGVQLGTRAGAAIRRFEKWGYRQAETICVNSPGFVSNLVEKGVSTTKVEVVEEWADESLFFPSEPDEELREQFGFAGKFNIVYGGNLGTVQYLSTVVEAAQLVQDLEDVQFVFIGDGNDKENLKGQVESLGLCNVSFIPYQPIEQIHRFFALSDALLVHLKREPIFTLQVPSKVIAYLACGRPVICGMAGTAETIVTEAQAGLCCPPEDPQSMAEQVRALYAMSQSEREAMGARGRQAYLTRYTRHIQLDRFEQVLKRVA